jgi:hypothetical protein
VSEGVQQVGTDSADARTFMKQETAGRKVLLIVFCSIWKNITTVVMHRREEGEID